MVSVSLMFLPHFDIFCNLLQNKPVTWNLFVFYDKVAKMLMVTSLMPLSSSRSFKPFNSQMKIVILHIVNHTILIMLVQRI